MQRYQEVPEPIPMKELLKLQSNNLVITSEKFKKKLEQQKKMINLPFFVAIALFFNIVVRVISSDQTTRFSLLLIEISFIIGFISYGFSMKNAQNKFNIEYKDNVTLLDGSKLDDNHMIICWKNK